MKILITLILFISSTLYAQWDWVNPKSTSREINDIAVLNDSTFIACGGNGTIYYSNDFGKTIKIQEYVADCYYSLRAIDFIDEQTGWIVGDVDFSTISPIVLFTNDGGKTWDRKYFGMYYNESLLDVSFIDKHKGWAVGSHIIAKTIDGGEHWEKIRFNNFEVYEYVQFTDSLTGYISANLPFILKTIDGGNTWDTLYVTGDEYGFAYGDFVNSDLGFMSAYGGKISLTTNGGKNWVNIFRAGTAAAISALNENDYILSPWDYGDSHSKTIIYNSIGIEGISRIDPQITGYTRSVKMLNNKIGYAVGDYGLLYKITPYESNFTTNLRKGFVENIKTISINEEKICCLTDKNELYVYYLGDEAYTKIEMRKHCPTITDILSIDNQLLGTTKAGLITIQESGYFGIPLGLSKKHLTKIERFEENIFVASIDGVIFKSSIELSEWESIKISGYNSEDTLFAFNVIDESTFWVLSSSNKLYRSTNGGKLWDQKEIKVHRTMRNLYFTSPNEGWVVGDDGTILQTSDAGLTWTRKDFEVLSDMKDLKAWENYVWVVGEGWHGSFYYSTNYGQNWFLDRKFLTISLSSIEINNNELIIAGENGTLIKRKLESFPILDKNRFANFPKNSQAKITVQNYPNPFNPSTTIKFSIPSDVKREMSNVKLIVYDILGREIKTLLTKSMPPGEYEVEFDAAGLPSGVYFYVLETGTKRLTKKMLLLK